MGASAMLSACCMLMVSLLRFNYAGGQSHRFNETCTAESTPCTSRLAHLANGTNSIAEIAQFYGVNVTDVLGANNLDLTETDVTSRIVHADALVLIPLDCGCFNAVRRTNTTIYTVQPGDTLSHIADSVYGHLVAYEEIATANNIPDPDQIQVGQLLVIPLPCACHNNTFSGASVVFLTYVIQTGDALTAIAEAFGQTEADLAALNQIQNDTLIQANDLLRIPLAACTSKFDPKALDYGLMVTNGSYSLSPGGGCVQSSCYGYPTPELHSTPARHLLSSSTKCPELQCGNNVAIGNFTTSLSEIGSCNVTSCVYDGYANSTAIFAVSGVTNQLTCPAVTVAPPELEVEAIPRRPGVTIPVSSPEETPLPSAATVSSLVNWSNVVGPAVSIFILLHELFAKL